MASESEYQTSTYTYKVADGLSLTLDVSVPKDFDGQAGTALIHFHGGFLVRIFLDSSTDSFVINQFQQVIGEKTTFPPSWLISACHRRHWAYITASYRLLPEATGLDILDDAIDACIWVSAHLTKRIILAGSSAGGFLALATAAHPRSPPPLCVLSIYGMLDLTSPWYTQPRHSFLGPRIEDPIPIIREIGVAKNEHAIDGYAFPEDTAKDKRWTWIRALHQEGVFPDILTRVEGLSRRIQEEGVEVIPLEQRALFPAAFGLDATYPPTALIHGDADIMVEFDQSERVARRLENAGVKVLLERVVGKDHGFDVEIPLGVDVESERGHGFYDNLRRILKFLDSASLSS